MHKTERQRVVAVFDIGTLRRNGFIPGEVVGPGRVWGEVRPGDTFTLPSGHRLVVKSRTKRYVTFHGQRTIDSNINIVHDIHPSAIYHGTNAQ
jgi:hypothetical protein